MTAQASLLERAEKAIPGAALGVFTLPEKQRVVIESGQGSTVVDADGKSYVDYLLSSGPLLLGHAHPEIVAAVQKQAALGSSFYALNRPAIELAETIVDAVPCAEALRYQSTGSEATFAALRLARAATGRKLVLKFEGGFHGSHDVAQMTSARMMGRNSDETVPESAGLAGVLADEVLIVPFNDLEAVRDAVAGRGAEIAAIMVEPLQRVLRPVPGFLEGLRALATKNGIVLIFDEVVTGFRLAWGGAQELYGVTPDLACYAKAIGGGYPLSAIAGRRDLLGLADNTRPASETYSYLGGTLTGNPISAAAGLACLNVLKRPGTYERLRALGARLREGLEEAGRNAGVPVQALGEGPVLSPLIAENRSLRTARDLATVDKKRMVRWAHEMIDRGFLLTPGGKMYVSLVHSDQDIERTIAASREAFAAVR
ncbi:MAG: aminotransferase class III-fold pyridoxal phosphate-dependent enzyme [Rhodospirillaceae bacterium]|nr:aminotransferase class III-fold pyridoxal phosphate-dependent enzyme [Rhodospirillaceae bacterium]